jgi:two-component system, cell cycle response regulator
MLRVLVADDDPLARYTVSALVRAFGYPVSEATDGLQAWAFMQSEPITLLITDWQMPGLDGPELIRRVRAANLDRYVSCLLLTIREQQTDRIQGLDAGADDYLVKPVDPDELRARLAIAARVLHLEQDLRAANERLQELANQLQHLAFHDQLTGLLNRHGLTTQATRELARVERTGEVLAAALMDIDHFKQINDQYGHAVGDQALAHVARQLCAAIRPYDLLGRWGGEEFLLLLPTTDPEKACIVAERVRAQLAAMPLSLPDQGPLTLHVSIGVAACNATAPDLDALVTAADQALYTAKAAGRNQVCCLGLIAAHNEGTPR